MKPTGIELHRHLEGSIRAATLLEIAREFHVPRVSDDLERFRRYVEMAPTDPRTFHNFLARFNWIRPFWVHREAIERAARQAVLDARREGVRYLELRFNPVFFCLERGFDPADVTNWIAGAVLQRGIHVELIGVVVRHLPRRVNEPVLDLGRTTRFFAGLDLAGDETADGLEYAPAFRKAASKGVGITVHAGEREGFDARVTEAMERFGARRIGHGTCALRNPPLLDRAIERGVTFEVCPSSSYRTGQVADPSRHPVSAAADAKITIGTDDPSIFRTDLPRELKLAAANGLSPVRIRRASIEAAFSSAARRA